MPNTTVSNRTATSGVLALSVVIFAFLLWLLYLREPEAGASEFNWDLTFMPALNSLMNGLSALCIVFGIRAIKSGNRTVHIRFMLSAVAFSALFLVGYLFYHAVHGDTRFQGEGLIRTVYFFILISHVVLSAVVLPLILMTLFFAGTERFPFHKRIARWTYPVWLYVSVTGVLVYLILYHWPIEAV